MADGVGLVADQSEVVLVWEASGGIVQANWAGAAEATVGRPVLLRLACWADADQVPA